MAWNNDTVIRASTYANAAHTAVGQLRKYTDEPYIVHPRAVSAIIHADMVRRQLDLDSNLIAAALLHDVVEDTKVTIGDLEMEFGRDIATLVSWVTDSEEGNRAQRRAAAVDRLSRAPARAQTIKVADLIDNTKSIVRYDPKFAAVYLREKADVLDVLRWAPRPLIDEARKQIEDGWSTLTGSELVRQT